MSALKTIHMNSERKALKVYTKLMRAAESVTARTSRAMAASDLTISQFGVLEALYHKGPLCQRDIATKNTQEQWQHHHGYR